MMILLLLFTLVNSVCTRIDRRIYKSRGKEFPTLFRSFGGLMVTKTDYTTRIVKDVGLTVGCAACYSDAYICAWDQCFWDCKEAGETCDKCLFKHECIQNCNKCTRF
jgi:hypothetical protein